MLASEHHISIFQEISKEDGFDSIYHYTLVFKDAEDNKYKSHVFFNEVDVICVQPKLFNMQDNTCLDLSPEQKDQLFSQALQQVRPIINAIKAKKNEQIDRLRKQDEVYEQSATAFSSNLPDGKTEFIAALSENKNLQNLSAHYYFSTMTSIKEYFKTGLTMDNSLTKKCKFLAENNLQHLLSVSDHSSLLLWAIEKDDPELIQQLEEKKKMRKGKSNIPK